MIDNHSWDGIDRRDQNLSLYRLDKVESGLSDHVAQCERLHKRVFITCVVILLWLVIHSPDVRALLNGVFSTVVGLVQ